MRRVPPKLRRELDATGLPWGVELGARHVKIRLAGQFIGILPLGGVNESGRGTRNIAAQVRRKARQIREDTDL